MSPTNLSLKACSIKFFQSNVSTIRPRSTSVRVGRTSSEHLQLPIESSDTTFLFTKDIDYELEEAHNKLPNHSNVHSQALKTQEMYKLSNQLSPATYNIVNVLVNSLSDVTTVPIKDGEVGDDTDLVLEEENIMDTMNEKCKLNHHCKFTQECTSGR